jgi:hypothetical protein
VYLSVMLHIVKFIVFLNWILMLLSGQEMLDFLNPILLKTLSFLKQVLLIMKIFLKMLFQKMIRILKLGNPKELEKK